MKPRSALVLAELKKSKAPITSGDLARRLGVTDRSIRNYVNQINTDADQQIILSSPQGYSLAAGQTSPTSQPQVGTPYARTTRILRDLIDARTGIDVHELASRMFVSDSTLESDIHRARQRVGGTGLRLQRTGDRLRIVGPETARRRLLSSLFRDESSQEIVELKTIQQAFNSENLSDFKTGLITALESEKFTLNEYGLNNVILHLVIAFDRADRIGPFEELDVDPLTTARSPAHHDLKRILNAQISHHFTQPLPEADLDYLTALISTRVATPDLDQSASINDYVRPELLAAIQNILDKASREYLVNFNNEDFFARLALHLHNLVNRARNQQFSRNPLTQSIKSSYPMIYDLAVFVAGELQQIEDIDVTEDEIAYIAMHIGAQFEQSADLSDLISITLVSPSYLSIPENLERNISSETAGEAVIHRIITDSDVDWESINTDLILTTIEPGISSDNTVLITPFINQTDRDNIKSALVRFKRARRRAQLILGLQKYFDGSLFFRNPSFSSPEQFIRDVGQIMASQDIITLEYIEGAIERERLSSTAFTDSLAVPHAMSMQANRTAIAISVFDHPVNWSGKNVQVVAFIAFSESGRASFQEVFDQFVEVFSDDANIRKFVEKASTFEAFITELQSIATG